jgi:hypothetical protein
MFERGGLAMVQLSLLSEACTIDLDAHVALLASRARACEIAPAHVARAECATLVRFSAWRGRPLETGEIARAAAYFEAVVRRAVIAATDDSTRAVYRRLMAASIEADLVAAGWNRARAAEEARRTVGAVA